MLQAQVIFLCIVRYLLKFKIKFSYFLLQLIFVLASIVFESLSILDFGYILLFIPMDILIPYFCIKTQPRFEIIFLSLYSVGFITFVNSTVSYFVLLLKTGEKISDLLYILSAIAYTVLIVIFLRSKKAQLIFNGFVVLSKSVKVVILLFIWWLLFVFTALTSIYLLDLGTKVNYILTFLLLVLLALSVVLVVYLVSNNLKNAYYGNINETIVKNVEYQKEQYRQLNENNNDLRKFRHDFENLSFILNAYLNDNDIHGARAYFRKFVHMSSGTKLPYNTGNFALNALLAQKAKQYSDKNIDIQFDGCLPCDVVEDVDLCIIFGNALDNAIEACLKLDKDIRKIIEITVYNRADMLFITMTNPALDNVQILNNHVSTTKADKSCHGIGLHSINYVARKYNGNMYLKYENGKFITDIELRIQNERLTAL